MEGGEVVVDGPFVMNTGEEIQQILPDYRDGLFAAVVVQAL